MPRARRSAAPAPLDPRCEEPLYVQIAGRLAQDISSGRLAPGMQVPSEARLMQAYGVSRVTVRQALQLLARGGQVVARRGKGTFVARPALEQDLGRLQGFHDALRSQGLEPQTQLLEFSESAGRIDRSLPQGLDLPVRLLRRYALDGRPFAVVEGFLPAEAAAVGERRARDLTVYDILQQFLGQRIAAADVVIRCARTSARIARELAVDPRSNILIMERTSRTAAGRVCEFMRIHIVPEGYAFRLGLQGPLEIARAVHPVRSTAMT